MGCGFQAATIAGSTRWSACSARWTGCARKWAAAPAACVATTPSSGNRAFDEYRIETLRRLEDEQREFRDFLDRLRMAKDKAEFDQFMAERRNRPDARGSAAAAGLSQLTPSLNRPSPQAGGLFLVVPVRRFTSRHGAGKSGRVTHP